MKQYLILLLLLITAGLQSQNLERFISSGSKAVVEVSGDQIFSLIDHADLEMLMPPDQSGAPMDLNQYGIDISSKAYYFYQEIDSTVYQNVVVRLSDVQKAEELIGSMAGGPTSKINGYNFVLETNMSAAWNNDIAIFSSAEFPKKVYTMDDLLEEQEMERMAEETEDAVETTESDEYEYEDEYAEEENDEMLEFQLVLKNMDAPYLLSDSEIAENMVAHFKYILNTKPSMSISQNTSYTSGKNSKSSAYFWVSSIDKLMQNSYPEELTSMLSSISKGTPSIITGIEELTGNLIFDTDEIRFDFDMGIHPDLAETYRDAYDSKMDESFFSHFNQDEALAFMNFTFDMGAMMKSYPEMVKTLYGSWLPGYEEEMDLAIDLIDVFLDEEAIAELITGDGLIILHDFEEQEVTYKTTEYDDDFNASEVEKTKMEPIPSFSFMLGSENERITGKLMNLAKKHGVAIDKGNFYRIVSEDLGAPFEMYFAHKDGIIFLSNVKDRIENFASGRTNSKLGKHKDMLENNVFNMYVDASAIMENMSTLMPADPETLEFVMENYKEMFITMENMKGDKVGYDVVIKTNGEKGNSLKLILDTITSLQGM